MQRILPAAAMLIGAALATSACSKAPAVSADQCKALITANYPSHDDVTTTVTFLTFDVSAPKSYTATYANDNNGQGHTVSATPVHAKYTVLDHYADPLADDQLRTYDAQYMCYVSPTGGPVAEMVSRLPGGETAQYIHKTSAGG